MRKIAKAGKAKVGQIEAKRAARELVNEARKYISDEDLLTALAMLRVRVRRERPASIDITDIR